MDEQNPAPLHLAEPAGPSGGGSFSRARLALYLPAAAVAGVFVAWVAEVARGYFAPVVLFPLLVGLGLGALLIAAMRCGHVAHRTTIVLGGLLAVAIAAVGQHYLLYRAAVERLQVRIDARAEQYRLLEAQYPEMPEPSPPPPIPGFAEYLDQQAAQEVRLPLGFVVRGRGVWLLWIVDGLCILLGAAAVLVPAMRMPYCDLCQRWYRTVRGGRISAATGVRLAEIGGLPPPADARACRYRISACQMGCGPSRLELSWEAADGETYLLRTWLDAATRRQLADALDQAVAEGEGRAPRRHRRRRRRKEE